MASEEHTGAESAADEPDRVDVELAGLPHFEDDIETTRRVLDKLLKLPS